MPHSKLLRSATLVAMIAASIGVTALAGWLIAHHFWQQYRAVQRVVQAVHEERWGDSMWMEDDPVKEVQRLGAEDWAVATLVPLLSPENKGVCWSAAHVLEQFGTHARPAIPRLVELFEAGDRLNPDLPYQASRTLTSIGLDAVPALIAVLKTDNRDARCWAVQSLGGIGPAAKAAVSELARILRDSDYNLHRDAADALAKIGRVSVPVLVEVLDDDSLRPKTPYDYDPRELAIHALGEIGPNAEEAIPSLTSKVYNYTDVRANVEGALAKIGPKGRAQLIEALRSNDPIVRSRCVFALGTADSPTPEILAAVRTALNDDSPLVRSSAAGTLPTLRITTRYVDFDATDILNELTAAAERSK